MKKWNEKNLVEKAAEIISYVVIAAWFIFEILNDKGIIQIQHSETISCIVWGFVCLCEAVSFWNQKRVFSYIAIGGAALIAVSMILIMM